MFLKNAEKLGIDIKSVDKVIVSHGHYDHGGGLASFLEVNTKAKIFINKDSFGSFYSLKNGNERYVGLDASIISNERFVFTKDMEKLDDELEIFSGVKQKILSPSCNSTLYMRDKEEGLILDDFRHEQNLIIKDNENYLLLSGCAHNGIVNILEHYVNRYKSFPTHVVGGFHLYSSSELKSEKPETVCKIGKYLLDSSAEFYTGHCTGNEAFDILSKIMGNKIHKIFTGNRIQII